MTQNPPQAEPTPPVPVQEQEPPGREGDMKPLADHGEETYVGHGRLTDRVALITGADSGIGRAVAIAFAREGADVLCSYLNEDDDAAETKRLVEEAGRRCVTAPGDIGDRHHCRQLVERTVRELGRLDVLVNNAAFQMSHESFLDIPPEEIDIVLRTKVIAMLHLCQAAVPHMEPGSTIINTTSIQAAQPSPELLHYAATKGAISTFTKGRIGPPCTWKAAITDPEAVPPMTKLRYCVAAWSSLITRSSRSGSRPHRTAPGRRG